MIYTVTFNPALDYIMHTGELKLGETNRSVSEEITIGGKGINVSYILNQFDMPNIALGFVAGFTGEKLKNLANEMGIKNDFITLKEGNTRINVKLKGDKETEINAAGPVIDTKALEQFLGKLQSLENGDTLVLSGSVPKCLPNDIYEQIMLKISDKNIKVCVDATGELLLKTLKYKPFLIKPNVDELSEIAGKKLATNNNIIDAARSLKNMGAVNVLVSMGKDGAILVDGNDKVHIAQAKKIKAINTVGAGDSMVAGFIYGAQNDYENALKYGIAAGSATASNIGLATKEQILELI